VYSSKYHCVWTPQYRRSVLVGPIAKRCEQVMRQTAEKYRGEIIAWEIMPDHVHVLVEVDPQFGIHRLVKNLKGVSSHTEPSRDREAMLRPLAENARQTRSQGVATSVSIRNRPGAIAFLSRCARNNW
jgi:REP element-mobilizing transposase RayT